MTAPPPWRRLSPASGAARLVALLTCGIAAGLILLVVIAPLLAGWEDAKDRAARLDTRAAALAEAARDRRAEAAVTAPDSKTLAQAVAYLDAHAPVANAEGALLDLISALRLIAQTAEVDLTTATPLDAGRSGARLTMPLDMAGLTVAAAEARLVTDHGGLARFLQAVEAAEPTLRAATLDVAARSTSAGAEDKRLSVTITIVSLARTEIAQ